MVDMATSPVPTDSPASRSSETLTARRAAAGVPGALPLSRRSVSWRVNSEPAVFLGGGRALLMQVAHPAVGAGVAQHSSYAKDPWGRLLRTIDIMMKLGFGTPEVSAQQQRTLRAMHRRVEGVTDDGTPYRALDPQLLLWVWATLVDTSLLMYELVREPLTPEERTEFLLESTLVAEGCGVPPECCPTTWGDFEQYVERMVNEELRVTDAARAVATAALVPPLPGVLARLSATPQQLATVGLLPAALRRQFGYDWDRARQRRLDHLLALARLGSHVGPTALRRAPAELTVRQHRPPQVPWLRRIGADVTGRRLRAAGFEA
jgi:uncharacterized protein (DUF2236 family)